jgi:CubicO group peptidase (beta-lactamase class C family)
MPMDISTSGFMASMTKLMTSVAVMQVVERGLVGLDDDLGAVIPELGDRMVLVGFDTASKTARFEKPSEKITLRLVCVCQLVVFVLLIVTMQEASDPYKRLHV